MFPLFSMIKSKDGIKCRGDLFWSVVDCSFEKDTIGHIFTGQYYGLQIHAQSQKIGKRNYLKVSLLGASKPKGLNMITKIVQGYISQSSKLSPPTT